MEAAAISFYRQGDRLGRGKAFDIGFGKSPFEQCLAVSFQEVVHSALTGNSEVAKPPAIRGEPSGHP
jgi:hypothetical protein